SQPLVLGEARVHVVLVPAQRPAHHLLARGTREVVLNVVEPASFPPKRDRSHTGRRSGELSHKRVTDVEREGDVLDELAEELLPDLVGSRRGQRAERRGPGFAGAVGSLIAGRHSQMIAYPSVAGLVGVLAPLR